MGILLKSQYTIEQASGDTGLARISTPNIHYIGPYLKTVSGELYVGDSIRTKGEPLVSRSSPQDQKGGPQFLPYDRLRSDISTEADKRSPYPGKTTPTQKQIENGGFTRYFFLDTRTNTFMEVTHNEFKNVKKIDIMTYKPHTIDWFIKYPQFNIKNLDVLKKLGSINISPYEYVKYPKKVPKIRPYK